jgi:hypothetical protein
MYDLWNTSSISTVRERETAMETQGAPKGDLGPDDVDADLERTSREIEKSVDEIAGYLNSQYARLVDHVATLSADKRLWQGEGLWTMEAWLAWRAGVSPATAGALVAIANRVDQLPASVERFRRGELSLDQMAAVARRAPSWTDARTAQLATSMTVRQIRRLLADYPFPDTDPESDAEPTGGAADGERDPSVPADPDSGSADANHDTTPDATSGGEVGDGAGRGANDSSSGGAISSAQGIDEWMSQWRDDDGSLRFAGHADCDSGAIIAAALAEARDRLIRSRGGEVSWLDALRDVAERSLDTVTEPTRRERFKVSALIDTDDKMTIAGHPVTAAVQRHLTCDGELVPVMLDDGVPLSVGRRQRIVPDRTRRVVEERDGYRCKLPGCGAKHFLEVHHIIHWLTGGPTDTWNLICLCPHHHRLHHRGRLGITGNADVEGGVTFTDSKDRPITGSGAKPIPPAGPPPPPAGRYLHPTGERFDTRWFEFHEPAGRRRQVA